LTYTFISPLCTLGFVFARVRSPANNLRCSKIHYPRRKPIHQHSCMYALWIHSNYLSPTITLSSRSIRAKEKAILRAIDEALESVGVPILWESKSMWEELIRVARIIFRAINQRDLISRYDGGKKWKRARGYTSLVPIAFSINRYY